jgi:hypothetical protein
MKLGFYIFLLQFFSTVGSGFLYAQEEGNDFVILNSGEKIYGEIIREFDQTHYTSVNFISKNSSENLIYKPRDIKAFGLDNGWLFLSKLLPGIQEEVFAQKLLTGNLTLLSYKGNFYVEDAKEITLLAPEYKQEEIQGRSIEELKKPYIGSLNILMAGSCGISLSNQINRTNYAEQDLIEIISKFHLCEGREYEVHVEQIKRVRVSPFFGAGYAMFQTSVNDRVNGRRDVLEKDGMPFIMGGVKVYQFRNLPKVGFDLGLGLAFMNNTLDAEYINPEVTYTGTEEFRLTSLMLPVFVNYSIAKKRGVESYVGLGGVLRFNALHSTFAIQDRTTNYNAITLLQETPFVEWKEVMVNPALKLGTHFQAEKSIGFLFEIQLEYAASAFSADLGLNKSTYNQLLGSLMFSIRY